MAYTTTLGFRRAWLTDALAPTNNPVVAGTRRPQDWTLVSDGEVRQYAGGRRQGVKYASELRTEPVQFIGLNPQQLATLQARLGATQLFRSTIGERFYCVYYSISVHNTSSGTSLNDGRAYDATLTLYEVDYDDTVTPAVPG